MINAKTTAVCGLLATFALSSLSPVLADSSSRQSSKNQWRNLGIVGAVVAGYGLLEHNQTATLLGAAGAAYSANRYEQDRHSQSQNSNDWRERYHRQYGNDNNYGQYQNNQYQNGQYQNNRHDNSGQYDNNSGYSGNSDQRTNHDGDSDQDQSRWNRDNRD